MDLDVLSVLGIFIYALIVLDILQTTLSMQGGGWLTSRFSHGFWKLFLLLSGKNGRSKILSRVGYILLIAIVLLWVLLLWGSLVLILYGNTGSVVNSSTKIPANFWEIVYYSGYTLSTMGMGDFISPGNIWRIITTIYSFTGIILLTMSVTYFIPVLSAVIDQRKLGISLSTLGNTPQEMVINSWNGKDFSRLTSKANDISNSIIKYSQQHRAYPVIHYFHNNKPEDNVVLQLTRLFEALLIISKKVNAEERPDEQDLRPFAVAYSNYFQTISEVTHISLTKEDPPAIEIGEIIEKHILGFSNSDNLSNEMIKDRRFFKTLLQQDGWSWGDVNIKSS